MGIGFPSLTGNISATSTGGSGGQPAARATDNHACPKHVGGPILPPTYTPPVMVNSLIHARTTDKAKCEGSTDTIVTGSATVKNVGQLATRAQEHTMHEGYIEFPCSPDTYVGGPSAGAVVGDLSAAKKACESNASSGAGGRESGSLQQSYSNCGLENTRQVINQGTDKMVNEDDLLDKAMENGLARVVKDPTTGEIIREKSGGTSFIARDILLDSYGADSTMMPQTMTNITQAVSLGRGLITSHKSGLIWGNNQSGNHSVSTVGLKYDGEGNLESVYINDPGMGDCVKAIDAGSYANSLNVGAGSGANVTRSPIW